MIRSPRKPIVAVLCFVGLLALLLLTGTLFTSNHYPTEQTAVVGFHLPDDFSTVQKILIATGATKQIITMAGDSEFVEEKWSKVGGSFNPFKPMRLELHGTMKVQSKDEYVGCPIVDLKQDVRITADEVHSQATMITPGEGLLNYDLVTHFHRDEEQNNTRVDLRLTQEILTKAPWFGHRIADRRVHASAQQALLNQKAAIIKLIEKHR